MTASAQNALVITCEHGGNRIPARYQEFFRNCTEVLDSHRGFDHGALTMARALASAFRAQLLTATVSRLLVDLNRSINHPHLHGEVIRTLPQAIRRRVVDRYYRPYRAEAEQLITQSIAEQGRVVHISCHSFTPALEGVVRTADIGLLYDPGRPGEAALCGHWKAALQVYAPALAVRRNYPYTGRNDGMTSTLRKQLSAQTYLGIELEINQKHVSAPGRQWYALREAVTRSLQLALVNGQLL